MRGRMAYPPERRTGKHRAASTARMLPAQRTWASELQRMELQEDAAVQSGVVVRRYRSNDPNDLPILVRYLPPDTEERRDFIVTELEAIHNHAAAHQFAGVDFVEAAGWLADEIERVKVMELVP